MDPVYGAVFSRVFLNEQLGSQGYLGAGLILAAIYISNTYTGSGSSSSNSSSSSGSSIGDIVEETTAVWFSYRYPLLWNL